MASTGTPRGYAGWRDWMLSKRASCHSAATLWSREVTTFSRPRTESALTKKASMFTKVNQSDLYHEKWWYTSQLFDTDWTPRDTLEHAPPAETCVKNVA